MSSAVHRRPRRIRRSVCRLRSRISCSPRIFFRPGHLSRGFPAAQPSQLRGKVHDRHQECSLKPHPRSDTPASGGGFSCSPSSFYRIYFEQPNGILPLFCRYSVTLGIECGKHFRAGLPSRVSRPQAPRKPSARAEQSTTGDAKPYFVARVNMYSAFSCFINKVYGYDDLLRDFDNLKRKRKRFASRQVASRTTAAAFGFRSLRKIPCNRFLPRTRAQRVAAGKIHKLPRLLFAFAAAKFYCFAPPNSPCVLLQSCKRIEHGAFCRRSIARKRNDGEDSLLQTRLATHCARQMNS